MSEIRQNLLAKSEETANVTESYFYMLKKSGATWIDKRIHSNNLLKFLFNLFLANESELTYTGDEQIMAKEGSTVGYIDLNGINSYGFNVLSFDNTDLSSYILTVVHNANSRRVLVEWYDNNWIKKSLDDLLTLDTVNQFSINFAQDIDGTHTLYYKFY